MGFLVDPDEKLTVRRALTDFREENAVFKINWRDQIRSNAIFYFFFFILFLDNQT